MVPHQWPQGHQWAEQHAHTSMMVYCMWGGGFMYDQGLAQGTRGKFRYTRVDLWGAACVQFQAELVLFSLYIVV